MQQHAATPMLEIAPTRLGNVPARVDRDRLLVADLRRGEPTAADRLVAAYGDRAFRLATRISGNAEDAEEVVQDALWSVIRKIETFRGESAFGTWLYRVVANVACRRLRKRRRRSAEVPLDTVLPLFDEHGRHAEQIADWSTNIEDPAHQMDLRILVGAAIRELPADFQAIVLLRDVEGFSYQEVAEALGLRMTTVRMRLHRARLFLRKRLDEHFWMAGVASFAGVA